MARVLVIEDEPDLRQLLTYNLREAGHEVTSAASGGEGLKLARERRPEVVLLDLMLPDIPGMQVCRSLRGDPDLGSGLSILILTAKGEEIDRVLGFELGADDYVTKPFSMRELLLRVQALLRRGKEPAPAAGENARDTVEFGSLRFDRAAHRAWVSGREIELTALELRLLALLYDRRNRVQSRTMLLNDVWGIDADVTTRTVDTSVKRLREKLGGAAEYVETVRGVGYRFTDRPPPPGAVAPGEP
ncbi:MAG TPA: response regulator transcription factor [Myxococcaceae bacterium]|jgi:two-component system phosphate regulon response regulator PhoB